MNAKHLISLMDHLSFVKRNERGLYQSAEPKIVFEYDTQREFMGAYTELMTTLAKEMPFQNISTGIDFKNNSYSLKIFDISIVMRIK